MERMILTLAFMVSFSLAAAGAAYAKGHPSAGPDSGSSRPPAAGSASECKDAAQFHSAALPFESPWIRLALANAERIGLSEDQVGTLSGRRREFQREAERLAQRIKSAEQELQRLLAGGSENLGFVKQQVDDIGALRSHLRVRRIQFLWAGRALLSATQLTELQALYSRPADAMHKAKNDGIQEQAPPTVGKAK